MLPLPVALLPRAVHREAQADARGRGASGERDLGDAFALDADGVPRVRLVREEAPPRARRRDRAAHSRRSCDRLDALSSIHAQFLFFSWPN